MTHVDVGGFLTGLFFLVVGVAFALEAAGVWAIDLVDYRIIGPVVLILVGMGVMAGAASRR